MRIDRIIAKPNERSLYPSILFDVIIEYEDYEIPISATGHLILLDIDKIISTLNEYSSRSPSNSKIEFTFESLIDNVAFDYIQNYRDKRQLKDINFRIELNIKVFNSVSDIKELKGSGVEQFKNVEAFYDVNISGNDWLMKYSPKLGGGKFMIVELPLPEFESIEQFWDDYIKEGIEILNNLKAKIDKSEWTEVIVKSREFFEIFRFKKNGDEIIKFKELLCMNNLTENDVDGFLKALDNLFQYASKFIHVKEKGTDEIRLKAIAYKEDAYFVYSLSLSIMNIILSRLRKRN